MVVSFKREPQKKEKLFECITRNLLLIFKHVVYQNVTSIIIINPQKTLWYGSSLLHFLDKEPGSDRLSKLSSNLSGYS